MQAPSKTQTANSSSRTWPGFFRAATIWILIVAACVFIGTYVIVRWAEKQVLTTENWVTMVAPLPKQPVVYQAIGTMIGERVFESADVEARIKEALPPKAAFLAAPLSSQLQGLTTRAAQQAVASDAFQTIWITANRLAMGRLLAVARGETPPLQSKINERFNIDISGVGGRVGAKLGDAAQAVPALQAKKASALSISADLKAKPLIIHRIIRSADNLAAILPAAIFTTILGAVALSKRRRITVVRVAIGTVIFLLLELIALRWSREVTLDQVQKAGNLPVVGYVYDQLSQGLRHSLVVAVVLMLGVLIVLALAGPAQYARSFRKLISIDRLQKSSLMQQWRSARAWTSRYKYYGWLVAVLLVLMAVAMVDKVTSRLIVNAVLIMISAGTVIYIFGTPPLPIKQSAKKRS